MGLVCIYMIINKINDKKYIGQTADFCQRIKQHIRGENQVIDKAINKYGWENFKAKIIEFCDKNDLDKKEKYWINYYNTYNSDDYNCCAGGNSNRGFKMSEKQKEKLRKPKPSMQKHNNPKSFIDKKIALKILKDRKENELTQKELSNKYDISQSTISKILRNDHFICEEIDFDFNSLKKIIRKRYSNKINKEKVKKIIKERKNNWLTYEELSNKFDVSTPLIGQILKGEHWICKEMDFKFKDLNNRKHRINGVENPNVKVNKKIAYEILEGNKKKNYKELANEYNLSISTIARICRKEHFIFDGGED